MGKLKEKYRAFKESRFGSIILNKFLLVTLFAFVWIIFLDTKNVITFFKMYSHQLRQEQVIRELRMDINDVRRERQELNSNRDSLEKFARERYYFHKEGETIYLFEEEADR